MKNICDWNNCSKIGEYKAPIEKDNSKDYRLLCLEHVKEFNKNWNYFSGMNGINPHKVLVHQIIFLKSCGIILSKMILINRALVATMTK